MTDKPANLFTRDDTFFGVCQGLGDDLGIPADAIRLAFVPFLFLAPVAALATYFALGLVVMVTHLAIRAPKAPAAAAETGVAAEARQDEDEPLRLAA